ncbi:DUF559 domain-containing protein [Peribacillus simplex]|uniref:DUF559 domain-containing protein n=1 Tax=Peribacillus simplex TaxID=1478 RepID=UPI000B123442|nr:DUF559 domain-containing protein [Peribacillus simplex]
MDYWENKLSRNKKRDEEVTSYYIEKGWHILRIWEHEVKKELDLTIQKIVREICNAKEQN